MKIIDELQETVLQADKLGLRLEIVEGLPIWEASPMPRHQIAVDNIRASIRPTHPDNQCGCFHLADVFVRFPDGSLKRPDISIFCQMPTDLDEAIRQVPDAVIEIISKGYDKKDLEIGAPFFISQGVKDVVVLDPISGKVTHFRADYKHETESPVAIRLLCGCTCTV